ncbi:MAG TPA: NADAR family protein [Streptosporangiaceae bacterium]
MAVYVDQVRGTGELLALTSAGVRPEYLMFWGHRLLRGSGVGRGCLSQWWPADFRIDEITYRSAEQYMMAEKAALFGDTDTARLILQAPHPGAAKRLGRKVREFDEQTWAARRFQVVVTGNLAKFSQDPALGGFLLATVGKVLVEAAPDDRIWGIGLAADDERAMSPEHWPGLNLLGFALMEVRCQLAAGRAGALPECG